MRDRTFWLYGIIGALIGFLVVSWAEHACAADLNINHYKAPLEAPYYDWTGFYLGIDGGGGWGNSGTTLNSVTVGKTVLPFNAALDNDPMAGFIGGGFVGYNYQFANTPIVIGIEGDFNALGLNGSTSCLVLLSCTDSMKWEADATGRVGFAVDHALLYLKGGAAWVNINHTVGNGLVPSPFVNGSVTDTPIGGLIGAGVEYAFTKNWIARVEYDYIGLNDTSVSGITTKPPAPGLVIVDPSLSATFSKESLSMFKGGVSYKF